jgi:hypothetical protein
MPILHLLKVTRFSIDPPMLLNRQSAFTAED